MRDSLARLGFGGDKVIRVPISTKLILSFLLIISITSAVFIVVGIRLIGDRIVSEAQEHVRHDLNAAREIYQEELRHINDVVHLTAERFFIRDALISGDAWEIGDELSDIKRTEGLDILTLTDGSGNVLIRTNNLEASGNERIEDELVKVVLIERAPHAATYIVPEEELQRESEMLAEQARVTFIDTPLARERQETELRDGMMLKAAGPVFDYENRLVGVLLGGILINRNFEIVDKIKQTVYENLTFNGKGIGTATIFQDDVRISTNVRNRDGSRAIGTRVSEEVYNQVVLEGRPWIGRAYVVNDWYITAYEPIRDVNNEIIGILYVGILEEKYAAIRNETILAFLAISLAGTVASMLLSLLLSKRISVPIEKLATASKEIAEGNLEAKVEIFSRDELGDLADSFNAMASSLKQREEQLREFTKSKIMESERLALIGQLAANVAHELNNPLQGIVTYSHLLLEKQSETDAQTISSIERIVTQANRCRDIIRGLLDFSRQRKPDTTLCNINSVMQECVSFVENQASFQNIEFLENFSATLPTITVDPSQMQQVFLNLIINAAEAMEEGGSLTLETRHDPLEDFIEIEISDTGHGIPEEHFDKLFDPFFTTKEWGHGTGLGLAISYGIVKEHGGTLFVESVVGVGTTFFIRLPMHPEDTGDG